MEEKRKVNLIVKNNEHHDICTWKDISNCKGCSLKNNLNCRFKGFKDTIIFVASFISFIIPAILGMIISGLGLFILGWLGYAIFFFQFWEIRILCRHCPFWAEDGKTLHCYANYGFYKVWKYQPEPMSIFEQIQFIIGIIILAGFFLPFLIIGAQYLMFLLTLIGIGTFFSVINIRHCPKCLNFSCPLNRVKKEFVDEYLKRNPVMKEAWEKKGYQID